MRIQLISDLHFEFFPLGYKRYDLLSSADVLVIAGDLAVGPVGVKFYLEYFSRHYPNVIYVAGNHEYYGHYINALDNMVLPSNVHFLNPGTVKLGNITFIGATMWTDFRNSRTNERIAGKYITDFKRIKGFTTETAKQLYARDTKFISDELEKVTGRKVIVTHFLPGEHCIHPRWKNKGYPTDELNGYFSPDPRLQRAALEELASNRDIPFGEIVWLFGHTHDSIDVMHNNVRYIANPYGYQGHEVNPLFNENLII